MITRSELRKLARTRLRDAEELFKANRFDGAIYLCGYAVELILKARICRTLKWDGFPETRAEFKSFLSFRTHNLDTLLKLSGIEPQIKSKYFSEWLDVGDWVPELRYRITDFSLRDDAQAMIQATQTLMGKI